MVRVGQEHFGRVGYGKDKKQQPRGVGYGKCSWEHSWGVSCGNWEYFGGVGG